MMEYTDYGRTKKGDSEMKVEKVVKLMIEYFGNDVRRINHALKVHSFARNIGMLEGIEGENLMILEVAAILHDIGIKESERKYGSSAGKYQEIEGPVVAMELLKEFDLSEGFKERVSYLIGNHHSYDKIDGIDFQILVEADFLVNIFEDGMWEAQIDSIKKKYFFTKTGTDYLQMFYEV